jgi:hypothetical protein
MRAPLRVPRGLSSSVGLALALALASAAARAEPAAEQRARADALFREGQQLMSAGQLSGACARLEESERLDPKLGRLLNVAYCHEQLGRTATAWREYNEAAALASQTQQAEREAFARKQANQLARRLSFVQLDVTAAPEVSQVTVDGTPLARDQWTLPLPLDPGEHTFAFAGAGRATRTQSVSVGSAGTSRVAVAPLDAEPPAQSPDAAPPAPPSPAEPTRAVSAPAIAQPAIDRTASPPRTAGWIVGGAGVAALAAGTFFGVRAMSLKSDADPHCPNRLCTPDGTASIDDAKGAATVATVCLAAGVIGVGVGTWLLVRPSGGGGGAGAGAGPARAAGPRVSPWVAGDRAGVVLHGAW